MNEEVKKEIIYDLQEALKILEVKEAHDVEELKVLSDHGIEDVALHKDLDLISVAVLIYSIYKVFHCMRDEEYTNLKSELNSAITQLKQGNLGRYNKAIKTSFKIVRQCNAKVKEHLQDVMDAAKIKKGTALLEKGLSMGQAAGLMGLSNWDLQQYAGKTSVISQHNEKIHADKRMMRALKVFGL